MRRPAAADRRTAVGLETLLDWALNKQKAAEDATLYGAEAAADGIAPTRSSLCGVPSLMRRHAIGNAVDGGVRVGAGGRVHHDAAAVADTIARLPAAARRMVTRYSGQRPAWLSLEQRLVPLPATAGAGRGVKHKVSARWEPVAERSELARARLRDGLPLCDRCGRSILELEERQSSYRRAEDGRREVLVKWCPVEVIPSTSWIESVNREYADWHAANSALLADLLDVRLERHRLTGFTAPAKPWESDR